MGYRSVVGTSLYPQTNLMLNNSKSTYYMRYTWSSQHGKADLKPCTQPFHPLSLAHTLHTSLQTQQQPVTCQLACIDGCVTGTAAVGMGGGGQLGTSWRLLTAFVTVKTGDVKHSVEGVEGVLVALDGATAQRTITCAYDIRKPNRKRFSLQAVNLRVRINTCSWKFSVFSLH